jgi:hypothetical protein
MALCLFYEKDQPPDALLEHLQIQSECDEQKLSPQDVIIRWGKEISNTGHRWSLNRHDAVQHTENRSVVLKLLRWSGLTTLTDGSSSAAVSARYMVPVFHGEALTVFRTQASSAWVPSTPRRAYREWRSGKASKLYKKICELAVRALYALGLDFGQVLIGKNRSGQFCILQVVAQPKLNRRLAYLFANAMNRMNAGLEKELQRETAPMLGTDLEFALRNEKGQLVPASRFMSKHGRVGHDAIWLRNNRNQYPLVELRPRPTTDPKELLRNIYKTMGLAVRKIKDRSLAWMAGALPFPQYPLGGHIHLSNIWKNHFLIRALDHYLTLPLMLIEDTHSSRRRPKYGNLGDVRDQFHGGFEYRTPPSWIVSPQIAQSVLLLVKIITNHYWELSREKSLDPEVVEAYYRGNKEKLLPVVESLWLSLAKTSTYLVYHKEMETFRRRIISLDGWKEREDIRRAWKLPPFGKSLSTS